MADQGGPLSSESELKGRFSSPGRSERIAARLAGLWVALLPIQIPLPGDAGRPINIAPSDLVLAAALVLALPAIRFRRGAWSFWHFAFPGILVLNLALFGVFSRYSIFNKALGILVLLGAYALLTSVGRSLSDVKRLLRVFVVAMGSINLFALAAHLGGLTVPLIGCVGACQRFTGFIPDPNLYGSILVVALGVIWANLGSGRHFVSRGIDLMLHLGLLLGLVLTLSRSAWIAAAAVIVVAMFFGRGGVFKVLAAGGVAVAGIVYLVLGNQVAELTDIAGRTGTIDSRFVLIDQGLESFASEPITGIGLGVFPELYGQIIHNTALWIAAELGVVGAFAFAGFLGWFLKISISSYRNADAETRPIIEAMVLGHVAMFSFSLSVEAFYQRHWWLLFAMSASLHLIAETRNPDGEGPAASPAGAGSVVPTVKR